MQVQNFFTDEQIECLRKLLLASDVKERTQGGGKVSYIDGKTAIDHANSIFGFGMWESEVISLNPVYQDANKLTMQAIVKVTIHSPFAYAMSVSYTDVGYGQMSSNKGLNVADAFEKAGKEAATDGLKRALRLLGNQFGLALYDKEQNEVGTEEDQEELENARGKIRELPTFTTADESKLKVNDITKLKHVYKEIRARQVAQSE